MNQVTPSQVPKKLPALLTYQNLNQSYLFLVLEVPNTGSVPVFLSRKGFNQSCKNLKFSTIFFEILTADFCVNHTPFQRSYIEHPQQKWYRFMSTAESLCTIICFHYKVTVSHSSMWMWTKKVTLDFVVGIPETHDDLEK